MILSLPYELMSNNNDDNSNDSNDKKDNDDYSIEDEDGKQIQR